MNKLKSVFGLKIGVNDYVSDIVSFELTSDDADADSQTFSEYNSGSNRQWTLALTAAFDGGSEGSLHDLLWNNAGSTVSFTIQPKAGVGSPSNPFYTGQVRIPYKPDLSIEAGSDSTFDYELELIGQPTKNTTEGSGDVFGDIINEYY